MILLLYNKYFKKIKKRSNQTYHKSFRHCYLHSGPPYHILQNGRCTFCFYTETYSWDMRRFLNENNLNDYQPNLIQIQKTLKYLCFLVSGFTLNVKHRSVQLPIYKSIVFFWEDA